MSANTKPDIGQCPACHSDLILEEDSSMPTGHARVCENPDCPDDGGAWPASLAAIRKWNEYLDQP